MFRLAVVVYAIGVAIGVWRTDAPLPARIGLALLWPIAVAAFVVTVAVLVVVALVALPFRSIG